MHTLSLFLLFACTGGSADDSSASGSGAPSLAFVTPADGEDISAGDVDCTVAVEGFALTTDTATPAPSGYIGYGLGLGTVDNQTTDTTFTLTVPSGEVTFFAELFQSDGSELDPAVTASVSDVAM